MAVTQQRFEEGQRATDRARALLTPGDRVAACSGCGPTRSYIFDHWDGCWMVSRSGVSDLHANSVTKVNGKSVTFRDTIEIDGEIFRRFIRYPEEVTDGTHRCIRCGQIDDEPWHEADICQAALDLHAPAAATADGDSVAF